MTEEAPNPYTLPGNSHKKKEMSAKPEKKVEKIITGEVVRRKQPLSKRFGEAFALESMNAVGNFILIDVVVPAIKNLLSDIINQGSDKMLYGISTRMSGSSGVSRSNVYTSYNRVSRQGPSRSNGVTPGENRRDISRGSRANHNFDEIVIADRVEAQSILDALANLIEQYDVATVSDLYDLVGITGSFTDDNWGWFSVAGSGIHRSRSGYLLNLPKPVPVD